jgi:hypothetical protein
MIDPFSLEVAETFPACDSRWLEDLLSTATSSLSEIPAKVQKWGYIGPGFVEPLIAFFGVPKGKDDIQLVYDGSVSGLNITIWVPCFFLL